MNIAIGISWALPNIFVRNVFDNVSNMLTNCIHIYVYIYMKEMIPASDPNIVSG